MKFRTLIVSSALLLAAAPVFAADAPPMLVRGTIASIDAKTLTITKADGTTVTGALLPTTFYAAVEPRRFDLITTLANKTHRRRDERIQRERRARIRLREPDRGGEGSPRPGPFVDAVSQSGL